MKSTLSAPIRGALYMTGAALCFAVMNIQVRFASNELHAFQIAFFRNFFALMFMMPWLIREGASGLKTRFPGRHFMRAAIGLMAMLCWFSAVVYLPIAQAVALNFSFPLFVTLGAVLILKETVGPRRWFATVCGLVGTLIILRPGFTDISAVMSLPIAAALFMAGSVMFVKNLSQYDRPATIVVYMNLFMTPMSLVPALFFWSWPGLAVWLVLVSIGMVAALAHILLTRSFALADASAVQPFDYARLPFVALLAFLAFGEVPDPWIWPGALMIAGSAVYLAHREARAMSQP